MTRDRLGMTVLEPDECLDLLRSETVGRIAVAILEHPDIFPINYVVDKGGVVFRSAEGTKLAAAVLGLGVAFEVDGVDPETDEAWSVVVKGRAIEIERLEELMAAQDLPLYPWHAAPKHRYVRIEPDLITGRRFAIVTPDEW